ncbi:Uncharacterised protein [[Clostridium] sordellii]|nr:Uncharacterised protein [[Clostridium] sordellii] [Paeniclostridium sordellii]
MIKNYLTFGMGKSPFEFGFENRRDAVNFKDNNINVKGID